MLSPYTTNLLHLIYQENEEALYSKYYTKCIHYVSQIFVGLLGDDGWRE
jgi:hypothetical protein